jgi:putative FmdB family regulatory protein
MPIYEFRCVQCGLNEQMNRYHPIGEVIDFPCPVCGGRLKRIYSNFRFKRGMDAHFNPSVGTYVSNERQFRDELKRKSDEASVRTGMTHNFVPVDINDKAALGVTDEGMDQIERNNALRQRGAAPIHVGETSGDSRSLGTRGTLNERSSQNAAAWGNPEPTLP